MTWEGVFTQIINDSHLVTGDELSAMTDRAVRPLGLNAEVLGVDLAQAALSPVQPEPGTPVAVEGTLAGRAYQLGEIVPGRERGGRVLWVPMLDGTDRVGVLRIGLSPLSTSYAEVRAGLESVREVLAALTASPS